MSQSEKTNNEEFNLAIFYWLVEDWQGCKQELKRLSNNSTPHSLSLAQILEGLIYVEKNNEIPQYLQGFSEQSFQEKALLQKFLWASIEKGVLKAKHLLGDEVSDSRIRKLIKAFTQTMPTPKSTELVKQTIIHQESLGNYQSTTNSVDAWITALQKKAISLGNDELLQAEVTLNSLNRGEKDRLKYKRVLADQFMTQNSFQDASRLCQDIIAISGVTESLVVRLSRAQRNLGNLEEAIETLESNIEQLGRKPLLLHMLAVYYRDQQNFQITLRLVKEIIGQHYDYSLKIGFAIFAADMLRKDAEYIAAYEHLKEAKEHLKNERKEVTLTVEAMLAELKANVAVGKNTFFEVSSVFYDTIYKNSDKYALEANDSIYEPIWKEVCNIITAENIEKIIDIGCGPGQFAEYLTARLPNVDYLGLDFSKTAISLAKERCPHLKFACEDVRRYTTKEINKETAYVMLEVLEHIEDDFVLLELLPKGTNVIFSVPNFDSFGHVRFFKFKESVEKRFDGVLNINEISSIDVNKNSIIYLVNAKL
ncbi:class I SAM-dependent methyltransferase [Idiomarina piscisalsi]|uniref:Methyltransferase domain-containing protein n=1 Tax=Idiomarina piscisalsi TaxID=1096243 RepID=A0A432YS04_9GAMM|nr:class I SAM-dependent methyltransferase [Idiomarina piscisalsi]RUO64309.1 hypothetical protein CWI73_09135 [Idiomarina piscisalsi]